MAHRSAITGQYISKGAAARHPNTSVSTSATGSREGGTRHRSAITGPLRHPGHCGTPSEDHGHREPLSG